MMSATDVDLTGRIALVTGGSSGLGQHFAGLLAEHGASVAITGRRTDRLHAVAEGITAAGGTCLPITMDVRDSDALVAGVRQIEAELGTIDVLINNAGAPDASYATKMPVELVDSVLDTNVRAPFLLSCEIARSLIKEQRSGRIINVSSIGAFIYAGVGAALYSITKAALNRMTETLAVEWAKFHINVNAVAPGAFASEMTDLMLERLGDITVDFPRKRLGQPPQLDSTILYLLSPASEFVTGTIIKVDDAQQPR
jgi:NAD(P)-dependent dehydrogenase (short-subunit alcohol dehydrogenase family)